MIRAGAGEDFLQADFEAGRLGFLEDMNDLKGLNIFQEQFDFPAGDTFENVDFAHAQFWHSIFNNAVFMTSMAFTKVYNCEFKRCVFVFNHAYGATFEKCRFSDAIRLLEAVHGPTGSPTAGGGDTVETAIQ